MSAAVGYGFGKHDWDMTDEQEKRSLKVGNHHHQQQQQQQLEHSSC